jgi:hypothetical protein
MWVVDDSATFPTYQISTVALYTHTRLHLQAENQASKLHNFPCKREPEPKTPEGGLTEKSKTPCSRTIQKTPTPADTLVGVEYLSTSSKKGPLVHVNNKSFPQKDP